MWIVLIKDMFLVYNDVRKTIRQDFKTELWLAKYRYFEIFTYFMPITGKISKNLSRETRFMRFLC